MCAIHSEPPHHPSLLHTDGVTVVTHSRQAANVIKTLCSLPTRAVVAWDTETTGINPKKQSPVGNGKAICLTAYAGENVDFGNGPRLFVDCLGEENLLQHFKPYFEEAAFWKCWHNYSFDRHILANHGIHARGFKGDTMHMARLFDTSRKRYSLEELAKDLLNQQDMEKKNMTARFGAKRTLKSGGESKEIVVPDTLVLHNDHQYRREWIDYATMDAKLTYNLFDFLCVRLAGMITNGTNCEEEFLNRSLLEMYCEWIVPFGEMLTDMEQYGFKVDVEQLKLAEIAADEDRISLEDSFRTWAQSKCPDAKYMNVHSDRQKQQLLFAPCSNKKDSELLMEAEKIFDVEQTGIQAQRLLEEVRKMEEENPEKVAREKKNSKKLKKKVTINGLGKKAVEYTASGWPSVNASSLVKLSGNPRANPPIYGDPTDPAMCHALADVIEASSIVSLQTNFIVPLQSWPGADGRIHASLNLNTETGRLSSRRPNLQNQPALDKDRYKVRKAFICEPGNRLIVADYGQLELRLMAHMTDCKSMLDAFEMGGDFHSRTAITMFDEVKNAVDNGSCLLERSGDDANSHLPLVKDMFAVERRKAKTLNFSIAYGKTTMGLARDWNVTVEEAQKTVNLWYRERKEVRKWQKNCRKSAREKGYVETMFGRRRHLPEARSKNSRIRAHTLRQAINAPLQGSAADVVMAAMLKLHDNKVMSALGWKVILQVHDEIILEGPENSADIALDIVKSDMENPLDFNLKVDLKVDAAIVSHWYAAK